MILLDTDHCAFFIRNHAKVVAAFAAHISEEPAISIVTVGELYFGAMRSARRAENLRQVREFIGRVTTIGLDDVTMHRFAEIKADLFARGKPMEDPDLLIGASALVRGIPLATHNTGHFTRLSSLRIEDWST